VKKRSARKTPNAWQRSAQFRDVASRAIRRWNMKRRHMAKCGARRRDGGECQEIAMLNGRCFRHGGKTPRGDSFHIIQWPHKNAPNAMEKMSRKLAAKQKEAAARERRVRLMSKAELAEYRKWQATHKPGSTKARAADRERRRQDREARASMLRAQLAIAIEDGVGVFG